MYTGKGALDLDSSPVISRNIDNNNPARLQRQTTPSEWHPSPERFHTPSSSPEPEPAEELPISPPSTPPLFTPEQPQEAQGQEAHISELTETSQAVTTTAGEAPPDDAPLMAPTPAQRRRSLPASSVYSSSLSTTNSRTKATSLPSNVFESSASNARRVPLPSVTFNKEAYGEILVPRSDSGELVIQSSSHEDPSPSGPQKATLAAVPKQSIVSPRVGSTSGRVNDTSDAPSSIPEPEHSQHRLAARLDELSRMALNGSYLEQLHGDDVQTSKRGVSHEEEAAKLPSPGPEPEPSYTSLPPSSIPIDSQSPTWHHHSATTVEETVVVEGIPSQATRHVTTKRARPPPSPLQISPLQSKRPKLMSREGVTPNRQRHGGAPQELFDAELLEVGIEVNLADYDSNPPIFPWGEGITNLDFRQPEHPLLITNYKLAEIWKSVCRSRGWCE